MTSRLIANSFSKKPNFRQIYNLVRFCATQTGTVQNELLVEALERKQKGIFVIGLNKPSRKNALSKSLVTSLFETLQNLSENDQVRVVVLRSHVPKIFCAGADLKERLAMPLNQVEPFVNRLRHLSNTLANFDWPTICAMDGVAVGGGLEMGLACDLRIAAESTKMGLVESKLAIIPGAGGTQRLPRLIGPSKAKELMFTAKVIDGKEAKEIGLVDYAVPQNENDDAAYQKAVELASEMLSNGPRALRLLKVAVNRGVDVDLSNGLEIERHCYAQVIPTRDRIEGLTAFLEKRLPLYTGE